MLTTHRLPGGAALAADTAEGARSFAAGFWFPIGSRHEAPHERGFVHFVEHMAFKGTSRRSAAGLSREIERVGGYINAFTDRDSICLHCQVPAANWKLALDVLADMAFESTFGIDDFGRERDVIVSEILAAKDDPEECAHDELLEALWPGDPLARKIAGETGDIRRAKRDALFDFYRAVLSPRSLLATTAGPVAEEDVAEELSRLMPSGRAGEAPRAAVAPPFRAARDYVSADTEQVAWFEAIQVPPPFTEDDYFAMAALNGALGEASSSRLFLELREKRGLCYSVYSAFTMGSTECLWIASANAQSSQLGELASAMDGCLADAAARGLSGEECEDALSRLAGSLEIALEDTDFRMRRAARQMMFSGAAMTADETRSRIAALRPEDLNAACSRLFRDGAGALRPRALFAYGRRPRRAARALGLEEAARRG